MSKQLLILVLFMGSCATQKNAEKYYERHPIELARVCGDKFPPKDSTADPVVTYRPADNIDYHNEIDSLRTYAEIMQRNMADMQQQLFMKGDGQDWKECSDLLIMYQHKVDSISQKAAALAKRYRPCDSDTLFIDRNHYITNTAKEFAQAGTISKLSTELEEKRKQARERGIGCLVFGALLFGALVLIFKK